MLLDTTRAYEAPEGVELELRLAGPVVRACAWAIDALIRGVLYGVIGLVLSFFGGVGLSIMLISFFLLEWFYPVVFEVYSGQTPGKKAMGIHVVHDNGTPISWSASIVRNLVRTIDFLPFLYGFGLISMLLNKEFRRLGDLAAGTLVTYKQKSEERPKLPEAQPLQPAAELNVDEQLLLLLYAERSNTLSSQRRIELANLLTELTGQKGEAAVKAVWGNARWLAQGQSS
ncbi:MAG: RDD family protein [Gammaproteobacteria bacterium]|nr:RDD family protein [Gammaproteobacteria bacterium]